MIATVRLLVIMESIAKTRLLKPIIFQKYKYFVKAFHMTNKEDALLQKYLPAETVSDIFHFLKKNQVHFKITNARKTKLGDYRCPQGKYVNHQITINGNLSKFAFLLVSLHEFAHLNVFLQYKNRVSSHGEEWKNEFRRFVSYYIGKNVFPEDLASALQEHIKNPSATIVKDKEVVRVLQKYNPKNQGIDRIFLSELDCGCSFELSDKMFLLIEKVRTRCKCKSLDDNRLYLVSANALVRRITIEGQG